jgi:hypothetical protein
MTDQDAVRPSEEDKGGGLFPPTRWTRIRQAGNGDEDLSTAATEEICRAYWYPLFVTARRKHGMGHHHAEDITQGFWAWVLANDIITRAVPERGRFRTFLLICFDRYVDHEWRKDMAQKRGGAALHISIQSENWNERFEREMGAFASPDEHLEHAWESASLEIAFSDVAAAWAALGKGELFTTLKAHLADGAGHGGIARIAAAHGMTEVNVRQQLFRLRKELRAAAKRWLKKTE